MSSLIHAAGDEVAKAVRPISAGSAAAAFGSARAGSKPLEDRALLRELWLISHFAWIAEATILRSLMIASGHELAPEALADRLGQLRQLGWLQERHSEAGAGRREWRLTDSGRSAV